MTNSEMTNTVVCIPPKRKYSIELEIKSIKKAKPKIINRKVDHFPVHKELTGGWQGYFNWED